MPTNNASECTYATSDARHCMSGRANIFVRLAFHGLVGCWQYQLQVPPTTRFLLATMPPKAATMAMTDIIKRRHFVRRRFFPSPAIDGRMPPTPRR